MHTLVDAGIQGLAFPGGCFSHKADAMGRSGMDLQQVRWREKTLMRDVVEVSFGVVYPHGVICGVQVTHWPLA